MGWRVKVGKVEGESSAEETLGSDILAGHLANTEKNKLENNQY